MVGTFTANGGGGITGGILDLNDADTSTFPNSIADAAISGSSTYTLGVDGRGQARLITTTPFGTITLDFVLSTSSHGLVTEYDNNATGSGTLDIQTAGTTPTGSYAFSFSGFTFSLTPYATAGNFTLTGTSAAGLEDSNEGGIVVLVKQTLTGSVAVSNPPTTSLNFPSIGTIAFDVFPIDAGHLKFIEIDQFATLAGDAFSQTSAMVPTGTLAFTIEGASAASPPTPFAAGGFMVTNGANITNASTEDYNDNGNIPNAPGTFTGSYGVDGAGRNTISFPSGTSGFVGGTAYAAYPSTGGLLLLEIDNIGVTSGAAFPQTSTAFNADGYALNLQGANLSAGEVDDIAEFVANTSGSTITGLLDENSDSGIVVQGAPFSSGVYTAPDANGRGSISTNVGTNSSNTTLNGGFFLNFYSVDGTTFPFIETDQPGPAGQVAVGVFVLQNASAAAAAASAHSHVFVAHPLVQAHTARKKKTGN